MSLTPDEKQELAQRISKGVQVVCSSVAQLHLGSPNPNVDPSNDESGMVQPLRDNGVDKWLFTNIEGALLLTKDPDGFCHFRIYDLDMFRLRFQYELYENLDYQQLSDQFHAFEMENCVCGFCFSSKAIADKFFRRVQGYIIRNSSPQKMSPLPPPARGPANIPSSMQASFNGFQKGRNKQSARTAPANTNDRVFNVDGTLDPNNVPPEWKRILKQAGIKKRDLKNPKMFQIIQDVLAQHNIDLNPPEEIDEATAAEIYNDEQMRAWKKYQAELKQYEEDQRRYERELEEYNRQVEQERKLQALMQQQEAQMQFKPGMTAAQRMRASVAQFRGNNQLPAIPKNFGQPKMMPRASVARPNVPALPVVPPRKKGVLDDLVKNRQSKVMIKANFLKDIKKNDTKLKHVSMLPTLKNVGQGTGNGILAMLQQRMKEQRIGVAGGDDDDDSDGSFSAYDGE